MLQGKNMVSKNSVNPGVVSPEVSSGDFWMKFLDEDGRELDSGKMLQTCFWNKEKCYKIPWITLEKC